MIGTLSAAPPSALTWPMWVPNIARVSIDEMLTYAYLYIPVSPFYSVLDLPIFFGNLILTFTASMSGFQVAASPSMSFPLGSYFPDHPRGQTRHITSSTPIVHRSL